MKQEKNGKGEGMDHLALMGICMTAFGVAMIRIMYGAPGISEYLVVFLTMAYFSGAYFSERKKRLTQARVNDVKMARTLALYAISGKPGALPICPRCASGEIQASESDAFAFECPFCGNTFETPEDLETAINEAQ